MDAEFAKKRIASYMRGDISREELDAFIDSFEDELTEDVYAEFLFEQFEEFVASDQAGESDPENTDTPEVAEEQPEQKKRKQTKSEHSTHMRNFSFGIKVAASCLFGVLSASESYGLKLLLSIPENLLTLKN